jgi:hypothetical protein
MIMTRMRITTLIERSGLFIKYSANWQDDAVRAAEDAVRAAEYGGDRGPVSGLSGPSGYYPASGLDFELAV